MYQRRLQPFNRLLVSFDVTMNKFVTSQFHNKRLQNDRLGGNEKIRRSCAIHPNGFHLWALRVLDKQMQSISAFLAWPVPTGFICTKCNVHQFANSYLNKANGWICNVGPNCEDDERPPLRHVSGHKQEQDSHCFQVVMRCFFVVSVFLQQTANWNATLVFNFVFVVWEQCFCEKMNYWLQGHRSFLENCFWNATVFLFTSIRRLVFTRTIPIPE